MARREVKIFTNLSDDKFRKDVDDEEKKFKKMVARMQDSANERGGYLRGRGALDTEDLLYLREMEDAEQDAERARIQAERRAFAQFRAAATAKTEAAPIPVLGQSTERAKPNARLHSQLPPPMTTFAVHPKRAKGIVGPEIKLDHDNTATEPPVDLRGGQKTPFESRKDPSGEDLVAATFDGPRSIPEPSVLSGLASYGSDEEEEEAREADERIQRPGRTTQTPT